jgi:NADP-dependent 3-hydroxy acid dehydrogenase YdfG
VVIGATSGLGRTMALGLAEAGADVVPAGRRESLANEVQSRIEGLGRRSISMPVDVRDRPSVDTLRDGVMKLASLPIVL